MLAVIKTGGKQYKVAPHDVIRVERLLGEPGETLKFKDVLVIEENGVVRLGTPFLSDTRVEATVLEQIRDDKVIIFKKNRRHNYRRKNGHRQYLTILRITDISSGDVKKSAQKIAAQEDQKTEVAPPEKKPRAKPKKVEKTPPQP